MSLQRGNHKKRGQKYKNTTAYKNDLYDTSPRTKALNNMVISEVCGRCTDVIQWKIKYKKYKPLTQPKKCTRCQQRAVKKAYLIMCSRCARENKICAKCGERSEIINQAAPSPSELASQRSKLDAELRFLSERERRTFFRNQRRQDAKAGDNDENDHENGENDDAASSEEEQSTDRQSEAITIVEQLEKLELQVSGHGGNSKEGVLEFNGSVS